MIARRPGDQWWVPAVALRHPLVSAVLMLGLVMAATWGCLMGLERIGLIEGAQLPMLLFILMATAVGVVVPVLKDRPDLGGIGQPLLIAGFLLEFVAIIGVGVVAALERGGIGWRFALLLAIPGALGLLVWLVNYGSDRFPTLPKTLHELAQTSSQLKIRAALALLVMFVALSQTVGTELVLGAFMAGLAATIISPRHGSIVRVKLDALGYGFFVPIFFIHAGATLDLGAVFDSWDAFLLAPLLLAIAFATKMAPALLGFAPVFGVRRGLAGGALLAANLSLVLAAGAIAEEVGIIDAGPTRCAAADCAAFDGDRAAAVRLVGGAAQRAERGACAADRGRPAGGDPGGAAERRGPIGGGDPRTPRVIAALGGDGRGDSGDRRSDGRRDAGGGERGGRGCRCDHGVGGRRPTPRRSRDRCGRWTRSCGW